MIIIKTFQELAQEMNISRQALYKRYKDKLFQEMSSHISKRGNVLFIDAEGEKILKEDFEQSKITPFTTALDNANLHKKLDKLLFDSISLNEKFNKLLFDNANLNKVLSEILSEIENLKTSNYQKPQSEFQPAPFATAFDNTDLNKALDKILFEIENLKSNKYQNLFTEIQEIREEIEVLKVKKSTDTTSDNTKTTSDNTILSSKPPIATNEEIIEMLLQNKTSREIQEKLKTSPKRIKKLRDSLKQE